MRIAKVRGLCAAAVALGLGMSAGCGVGGPGLPQSVDVTLPDGTTTTATLGSGVVSLANSKWEFVATSGSGQGLPFVTIQFGENGELDRFTENTIAADIFGDTIIFDGATHNTTTPGVTYAAATFGAETSDASGFAFEGRLNGFAAGLTVATATANASGSLDPDDPNRMTGRFAFEADISVPGVPQDSFAQVFNFVATKVEE